MVQKLRRVAAGDTTLDWLGRVLLTSLLALAAEASGQQLGVALDRRAANTEIAAEIRNAAADQLYAVELGLGRPATVGELRATATELKIPRALAFVEYDYGGNQARGLVILGLGEMYAAANAREHSECRALLAVNFNGQSDLKSHPIDAWPVHKMHVYATAHVVRDLTSGKRSPAAILHGSRVELEHLRKLEEYVRNETSQAITKPSTVALPAYCAKFVGAMDTPVLAGELPPDIRQSNGATFREHVFRILGQLPADSAVTITLKLDFPANIETLAALVQEYEIRGLQAELVPQRSSKRIIADAQLSTYGAAPAAQVHRVRCQMRLGGEEPQASSEWYADWISVSLSTDAAVRFLSYPKLEQAQVSGVYPITDLERLRGYYERLATRVYEMPRSIEIPGDCGDVYVHNDQDDPGSLFTLPQ